MRYLGQQLQLPKRGRLEERNEAVEAAEATWPNVTRVSQPERPWWSWSVRWLD